MNEKKINRKHEIIIVSMLFMILWMIFFWRSFTGHVLSGGDLVNQYIPYKQFFKDWIGKGIFPLWNPYTFSGRPFMADIQIGMFYPPNWFCFIMPVPVFFTFLTVIHLWFASIGAYFLAGRFLRFKLPRFLFALTFTFSAFFTARLYSGIVLFIFTASYIPWILLVASLWHEKRSNYYVIWLGILLALQLLCGSPQVAWYCWIALGILFILQMMNSKKRSQIWKFYAIAFIIMFGLSAVQFLPTKEYIDHSYERSGGSNWEYITDGSLNPNDLLTFVFPSFCNVPKNEGFYWATSLGFWEFNGYVGIAPLLLSILFFFTRPFKIFEEDKLYKIRRRWTSFSIILFVLWLCLAFGKYFPVFRLFFYIVPGFNKFRVPSRIVIFYIFALSFFSSSFIDRLLCFSHNKIPDQIKLRRRLVWVLSIIFILSVVFTTIFFMAPLSATKIMGLNNLFGESTIDPESKFIREVLACSKKSVITFIIFSCLSSFLIFAFLFLDKFRNKIFAALLFLLALDLFLFANPHFESVRFKEFNETYYPDTQLSGFIEKAALSHERIAWIDNVFDWNCDQNQLEIYPNRAMMKSFYDVRGYDPVYIKEYGEFFNAISHFNEVKSPGGILKLIKIQNPVLLSLLNVRYILSYEYYTYPEWKMIKKMPFGLYIYENKTPQGNAFLLDSFYVAYSDVDKILKVLGNPKFSFLKKAMTTGENPYTKNGTGNAVVKESVKLIKYTPNEREYEAVVHDSDTLVFSEIYYPGWRVFVDGKPATAQIINHALWGVFLPEGKHNIVCKFRPLSFITGAIITMITILSVIIGVFVLWKKKLKSRKIMMQENTGDLP
jgi:membrane protein YfhO